MNRCFKVSLWALLMSVGAVAGAQTNASPHQQLGLSSPPPAHSAGVSVSASAGNPNHTVGVITAPQNDPNDRLDNKAIGHRAALMTAYGAAVYYGTHYGNHVIHKYTNFAHVGGNSASLLPVNLKQVPVLGTTVNRIPIFGNVVAGSADPIIVGAVAIDNYVIPKYSPTGYTKSATYAATNDFNSAPKLRHYVNYLAPQPYTHPPVYDAKTLYTDLPADTNRIQSTGLTLEETTSIPY